MTIKAYISTISPAWPLERQRALLGEVERVYIDKIGPKAVRDKNAAALKERAAMLKPTSRGEPETIRVATPATFALDRKDFGLAVTAASARLATLVFVREGLTLPPSPSVEALAKLLAIFEGQHRTRGFQKTRPEIATERMADSKARAEKIRPFWHLPSAEHPTPALLAMAGRDGKSMAHETARGLLGRRPEVQRAYQNELNREAGRRAGATPGRKPKL